MVCEWLDLDGHGLGSQKEAGHVCFACHLGEDLGHYEWWEAFECGDLMWRGRFDLNLSISIGHPGWQGNQPVAKIEYESNPLEPHVAAPSVLVADLGVGRGHRESRL